MNKYILTSLMILAAFGNCNSIKRANSLHSNIEVDFLLALQNIYSVNDYSKLFKLYADSSYYTNSGIFITEDIQKVFDNYMKSNDFNDNFYYDEDKNFRIKKESIYIKLLKKLAKERSFYEKYLRQFEVMYEVNPALSSATNYYVLNSNYLTKDEQLFLTYHYAILYFLYFYY